MNIEAVVAALGTVCGAKGSAVTERALREYNGPLPSRLLKSQHHAQRGLSSASISGRGDLRAGLACVRIVDMMCPTPMCCD
ncbi:hypothetical protein MCEMIE22_01485 [Mycobacteriaceae bacterium]|jgi:hypothetical protein